MQALITNINFSKQKAKSFILFENFGAKEWTDCAGAVGMLFLQLINVYVTGGYGNLYNVFT